MKFNIKISNAWLKCHCRRSSFILIFCCFFFWTPWTHFSLWIIDHLAWPLDFSLKLLSVFLCIFLGFFVYLLLFLFERCLSTIQCSLTIVQNCYCMFGAFFGFFGEYISVDAHKNQISVFYLFFEQWHRSQRPHSVKTQN